MTGTRRVAIDAALITDWNSFHDVFAEAFEFPSHYGRNMNAWIDCMSDLDLSEGEVVVLELKHMRDLKRRCPEQYDALIECSAFVNCRELEAGELPRLMLSFE